MIEWLLSPIDPSRIHEVGFYLSWHARFMVVAWGCCIPLGIISARFLKIWPGQDWPNKLDSQIWWNLHRTLQYSASVLTVIALVLVLLAQTSHILAGPHRWFGWTLVALLVTQLFGVTLRGTKGGPTNLHKDGSLRGDHYDRTLRRRSFEVMHKVAGYSALGVSILATVSGLWQSNALRWMWIVIPLWWVVLIAVSAVMQHRGLAVSSYYAIWGTDEKLPGNLPKELQ